MRLRLLLGFIKYIPGLLLLSGAYALDHLVEGDVLGVDQGCAIFGVVLVAFFWASRALEKRLAGATSS